MAGFLCYTTLNFPGFGSNSRSYQSMLVYQGCLWQFKLVEVAAIYGDLASQLDACLMSEQCCAPERLVNDASLQGNDMLV